jgi:GNAT superfamily N-acetyltransferase
VPTANVMLPEEIETERPLSFEAEALLDVPAGYGGRGAWLDASDAPALGQLLASCGEEVALVLGRRRSYDAALLIEVGAPGAPRAPAGARHMAGLFDGRGEMTAFVEIVRDHAASGTWRIPVIAVRHDLRNCGIGGQILEAVEDWARAEGARELELRVPRGNVGALRFALRSGFEDHGEAAVRRVGVPERATMVRRLASSR